MEYNMKKSLQRVLLYSCMHIPVHRVLCNYLVNYEHLGAKLLLNNENPSSSAGKALSVIRKSAGAGQRQAKIRM